MKTIGHNIGNVELLVENLSQIATSHKTVGRMEPDDFCLVGPLTKQLADK
jgi:hypothetical protein